MAVIHWKGGDKVKVLSWLTADTFQPDTIELTLNVVEIKIAAGELQAAEKIFHDVSRGRQVKMAIDPLAVRLRKRIPAHWVTFL